MNFLFPILAAVLQASSFTLDKIILSIKKVDFKMYIGVSFPLFFIITLVIFIIFRPPLALELFSNNLGWLIMASVGLSIISNLIYYRALEKDKLLELETLGLLSALPVIILSSVIFTDERNFFVVIPAIIASVAIIWSHWEHHRFKIAKKTSAFLLWTLLIAPIAASISKILLSVWNPISLELVRSAAMALILGPLFFHSIKTSSKQVFGYLLLTNILTSVAWILFYFSYQISGIVYTMLLFSLQPLLVYFASLLVLKEPFRWKRGVAFIIILISIGIAHILR